MLKQSFPIAIVSAALCLPLAGCEVENDDVDATPTAPATETDMDPDVGADDELMGDDDAMADDDAMTEENAGVGEE